MLFVRRRSLYFLFLSLKTLTYLFSIDKGIFSTAEMYKAGGKKTRNRAGGLNCMFVYVEMYKVKRK